MLSKEEFKNYKITFWNEFKAHMSKHRGNSGRRMNWLQYRTDLSDIYFRLETDKNAIRVCFDIQYKDEDIRSIIWEQMGELKQVLINEMGEEGIWNEHHFNSFLPDFCRIYWEKEGLNYLRENDRQAIFDFFEDKLVRFDRFYDTYKDILIALIK